MIVIKSQSVKPINVSHMEAENDVMNLIVKKVQSAKQINVSFMEVENDNNENTELVEIIKLYC